MANIDNLPAVFTQTVNCKHLLRPQNPKPRGQENIKIQRTITDWWSPSWDCISLILFMVFSLEKTHKLGCPCARRFPHKYSPKSWLFYSLGGHRTRLKIFYIVHTHTHTSNTIVHSSHLFSLKWPKDRFSRKRNNAKSFLFAIHGPHHHTSIILCQLSIPFASYSIRRAPNGLWNSPIHVICDTNEYIFVIRNDIY